MERLRDDLGLGCIALTPGEAHVTVAEVVRGESASEPRVRVGDQIPIAPPLGVGYVGWADPPTLRRWLDAALAGDPALRPPPKPARAGVLGARPRRRTRHRRRHRTRPHARRVGRAARRRRPGTCRTWLRTLMEEIAAELRRDRPGPGRRPGPQHEYRLGRIGAGVLDPAGDVALVLVPHGFRRASRARGSREIGERLAAVAREVSAKLAP
ncbi:hypothetical protein ACU686_19975 [Yinghuangia aomiensis]